MLGLGRKPDTEPKPIVELLQRISKRAEELTQEEQARSYVSVQGIGAALTNRDNRIIFGRRGTGKTHLVSYLHKSLREMDDIPIVLDLRTIGSNNSIYANSSVSI